ncbi:MAG TPA: asparagine synthase (glutamine-hydrolyzing) [Pirellulales bacterium]|nr:asparagine synthase (glutamine-hydrolyzing) [Pirellulales bacterium]
MCGIFGAWYPDGRPVDEAAVERSRDMLINRGPDDAGTWINHNVALTQRRLAIIDLSPNGRMPMTNETGDVWVTYNGEIYNFQELRAELLAAGHWFRSETDSEVIVHAYEQWQEDCFARFDGMFAIAIWDQRRQRMILARDPHGKKPLFYFHQPGKILVFASTLRPIAAWPDVPRDIDESSIYEYIKVGYLHAPRSLLANTYKVCPGHYLVVDRDGVKKDVAFWDLAEIASREPPKFRSEAELLDQLDGAMRAAVRKRLVSDVPLGAFLSGGTDSSLVVALMREVASDRVRTFTIGFTSSEFDESRFAQRVAQHLGVENTVEHMSASDLLAYVPEVVRHYDEPIVDFSLLPTMAISQMARRDVTVVLSGDGGDELFGGYERYLATHYFDHYARFAGHGMRRAISGLHRWLPRERMRRFARLSAASDTATFFGSFANLGRYAGLDTLIPEDKLGEAPEEAVARFIHGLRGVPATAGAMVYDATHPMIDGILVKVDRATMGFSLEARAPLLDKHLWEMFVGLPLAMKVRGGQKKYLLRKLLYRYLPKDLVDRPKMGFTPPLRDWFRNELREQLCDTLSDETVRRRGYFKPAGVQRLLREHLAGQADHVYTLWALFMLELWMREFADQPVGIA